MALEARGRHRVTGARRLEQFLGALLLLLEVKAKVPEETSLVVVIGHGKPLSCACVRSGRKGMH